MPLEAIFLRLPSKILLGGLALCAGLASAASASAALCATGWSASTVYTGGQTASYAGVNYTANWWTQGNNPSSNSGGAGTGEPWTANGSCGGSSNPTPTPPTANSCAPAWSASSVYTAGQTASFANINYTANWWTQGNNPSANSGGAGSGEPWTANGACGSSSSPPPAPPAPPTPPAPPAAGTRYFAPYIDMSLTPDEQILAMQQQAGLKALTMAFLVAANGCGVGWGGLGGTLPSDSLSDGQSIQTIIGSLASSGVQVILSFGGALGQEPALACTSAAQLQALYQSVINLYHVNMLDFDIEGSAVSDQASITRRDQALKALKAANPGLVISYTLPVLPTGLVPSGVNILTSAKADGLALDVVNIMAMDYGSAVDNGGKMGPDATQAAAATESQIEAAGLASTTVGITPMIGVNDTNTEVFQLTDAQTVLSFAEGSSYVTRLAMWSLARDNGSCPGQTWASPTCSGIAQLTYSFSDVFAQVK